VLHRKGGVPFELVVVPGAGNGGTDATSAVMFLLLYSQDGLQLSWEGMGWDIDGKVDDYPHAWWTGVLCAGMYPLWVEGLGGTRDLDTTWRDIRMTGEEMPGYVTEVNLYAHMFRNMAGNHVFTDSHYDTIDYGPAFFVANGATISIGGNRPQDQVTARNTWVGAMFGMDSHTRIEVTNMRVWREDTPRTYAGAAVQVQASNGNQVRVSGLETSRQAGVWMGIPNQATEKPTVLVEHSTIRPDPTIDYAGIELWDNKGGMSEFVIRNNRIVIDNPVWGGPIVLNGTQGPVITNNTLSGSGPAAIWLGVFGMPVSDAVVKGNNVQGWTVDGGLDEPDWHGAAAIWLGPTTSGNTVVGGGKAADMVYDETDNPATPKYDGANFLTGVNSRGGVIGDAVRRAMQMRKEIRDLFN
jgi:hypothetical protein